MTSNSRLAGWRTHSAAYDCSSQRKGLSSPSELNVFHTGVLTHSTSEQ